MEWTRVHGRIGYVQWSKGNNSKSRQTRVMVHVFWTSSDGALHLCEVSWKYLKWYQSYRADTKLWSAYGCNRNYNICYRYKRVSEYSIYPIYWDTLTTYFIPPKIWTAPFDNLLMCLIIAGWVTNSVDADQTLCSVESDLGLHCLFRSVFMKTYVVGTMLWVLLKSFNNGHT